MLLYVEDGNILGKIEFNRYTGMNYKMLLLMRIYMHRKSIKGADIAEVFGITQKSFSKICRQNYVLSADRVFRFCRHMTVPIDTFYTMLIVWSSMKTQKINILLLSCCSVKNGENHNSPFHFQ